MEYLDFDMDTVVRVLTAFVSFAIVGRLCTFQATGKRRKLKVALVAWFLVFFCFMHGVYAITSKYPASLSSLGIVVVILIAVLATKGNLSPYVRRHPECRG